jgi:hypothetical protein
VDEELAALTRTGALAFVTALAADVWKGLRRAAVRLSRLIRLNRRSANAARLDSNAALQQSNTASDFGTVFAVRSARYRSGWG